MKAILINPVSRTVTEIEIDGGLQSMYAAIGCSYVEAVYPPTMPRDETLYVDEEGLFAQELTFFKIDGYHQPLAGNGLIVGLNTRNGDARSTRFTADKIRELITFEIDGIHDISPKI